MSEFKEKIGMLEIKIGRCLSFIEGHYIKARALGTDHAEYIVANDLDNDKDYCNGLHELYEMFDKLGEKNVE